MYAAALPAEIINFRISTLSVPGVKRAHVRDIVLRFGQGRMDAPDAKLKPRNSRKNCLASTKKAADRCSREREFRARVVLVVCGNLGDGWRPTS
jgi:hypothetical protein